MLPYAQHFPAWIVQMNYLMAMLYPEALVLAVVSLLPRWRFAFIAYVAGAWVLGIGLALSLVQFILLWDIRFTAFAENVGAQAWTYATGALGCFTLIVFVVLSAFRPGHAGVRAVMEPATSTTSPKRTR
jgi:hypothetical protein